MEEAFIVGKKEEEKFEHPKPSRLYIQSSPFRKEEERFERRGDGGATNGEKQRAIL